jgi:heterotetrameric sarcosine oxidase gamma subunit
MAEHEFQTTRVPVCSVSLLQIHEGGSAEVAPLAARSFGDAGPGQSKTAGPRAFAISPTEWLLIDYPVQEVRRRLAEGLGRALVRLTDISAAFVSLRVEGNAARAVLASEIGAPWAAGGSQPGQYVCTRLAQVDVILHCVGAEAFELLADRSFAEHLEGWLAAQYAAQSAPAPSRGPGTGIR